MSRFFAGAGSALLLVLAGFFAWKSIAQRDDDAPVPPAPPARLADAPVDASQAPPSAEARTREQRRFDRADRDNDGLIRLDELYYPRHRAFARLDANGDGRLSFEEWAVRTRTKFEGADADRDGRLTRAEYATTAPRPRRAPARDARCDCERSAD
jgi:hypothetical protein